MKKIIQLLSIGALFSLATACDQTSSGLAERVEFLEDQYQIGQLVVVKYSDALNAFNAKATR